MKRVIIYDWRAGFTKGGLNRLLRKRAGHSLVSAIQAVDGLLERRPIEVMLESGCSIEEFLLEVAEVGAIGRAEGVEVQAPPAAESAITLSLSEEVMNHLKQVAPAMGFESCQGLVHHYIMQGLKMDLEKLKHRSIIESLKRHGVDEAVITQAMAEAQR